MFFEFTTIVDTPAALGLDRTMRADYITNQSGRMIVDWFPHGRTYLAFGPGDWMPGGLMILAADAAYN